MNIRRLMGGVIRRLFPLIYWELKIKSFNTSQIIYKRMSYDAFLEQALKDFCPNLNPSVEKQLKKDILRSYIKDRTRPDEYLLYKFNAKSESERNKYMPQAVKDNHLVSYYGSQYKEIIGQLRNKFRFYELSKDFFKRDVILIGPQTDNLRDFKHFCSLHTKFIAKEVDGGCGVGIKIVDSSSYDSIEVLYRELSNTAIWMVEELIQQHQEISSFNASSVNTVRFPSFKHGDKVVAARPCMRFGREGNIVDNAGQGVFFVSVDINTGEIISDGFDEHGHKCPSHPDSNKTFKGFVVPQWKELIEVARVLHLSLPEDQVYVAFDFALSDKGWVVVEGNWGDWILQQVSFEKGLRREFISLLNDE